MVLEEALQFSSNPSNVVEQQVAQELIDPRAARIVVHYLLLHLVSQKRRLNMNNEQLDNALPIRTARWLQRADDVDLVIKSINDLEATSLDEVKNYCLQILKEICVVQQYIEEVVATLQNV